MDSPNSEDTYSEAETAARSDAVLKRMLNTPPKPHPKPKESTEPRRRGRPIGGGKAPY